MHREYIVLYSHACLELARDYMVYYAVKNLQVHRWVVPPSNSASSLLVLITPMPEALISTVNLFGLFKIVSSHTFDALESLFTFRRSRGID